MVLFLEVLMSIQRVKKYFVYHLCFLCMAAAILLLCSSLAQAVDCIWTAATGNWSDTSPNPWNAAEPLTTSDYAYITNGGTANITQAGEVCLTLYVGHNFGTTDTTGHVVMTGGDLTLGTAGGFYVGNRGTGTFEQSSGTVNGGAMGLKLGGLSNAFYTATGTYTLSGNATLTTGAPETIGQFGTGHFIQNGGTHKVYSFLTSTYSNMVIGQYPGDGLGNGGVGTYEMNDGTLTANQMTIGVNSGSTGQVSQAGGTVTLTSATTGINLASGVGSTGTYNLTGGTLILNVLKKGTGTANFNFGGGTLKAGATLTSSLPMNLSGIGSNPLTTYNATVDTAGKTVTLSGVLSGVGGLNKAGSGSLKLNNVNSYAGLTDVTAGTLGGSGTIPGAVIVRPDAGIAPGDPARFTVGSITFEPDSFFDVIIASDTSYDSLNVLGTLAILPDCDLNVTLDPAYVPKYCDTFDILDWGSKSGMFIPNLPALPGGLSWDLSRYQSDGIIHVVPEPGMFVLLITAGLALLGIRQYRRKEL
jgi:hypothetical protein